MAANKDLFLSDQSVFVIFFLASFVRRVGGDCVLHRFIIVTSIVITKQTSEAQNVRKALTQGLSGPCALL